MELRICHLYGDYMNTYGDDGNIITLEKRASWRRIKPKVFQVSIGDKIDPDFADIYFFGGGQDKQQIAVAADLEKTNGKLLRKAVANGAVILSICGGYQLLGKFYEINNKLKLPGVGLIDTYTQASNQRMIGNLVIELDQSLSINHQSSKLVGFENHSGQTFLGKNARSLGKVISGFGNNGQNKTEGAWNGNVFGCYLHGPVLPKNPHFADFLIAKALERRYGTVKLKPLNDSLEWQTHNTILARFKQI